MSPLAPVLVDGHRFNKYSPASLALCTFECQNAPTRRADSIRLVADDVVTMDKIVSLSKRRGFVFPSSEIYGGLGSSYDYGHYGVLLKNNVKGRWWRSMLQERDDIVALDSAIIQHPRTWLASGHLAGFTDPLVDCRTCKLRFRADHIDQSACGRKPSKHPGETPDCDLTEARDFNLMFETTVGPVKEEGSTVYLRPETAQGIFLNFKNYLQFSRKKPPFGIAQIGKSFRNEITPGNFIFRTREFEQMEMEYFVPPDEAQQWFEHWLEQRMNWYLDLGIRPDHVRLRAHDADELSHYSSGTSDVEYLFPIGWSELEGIANRGNFDLTQHAEYSGQKLEYVDTATKERYVPHVIEPAAGADRAMLAFLVDAYDEDEIEGETRTVLRLHPVLAPVKVAVLPLVRKDGQPELAHEVYRSLRDRVQAEYDEGGAIGRRYRRQDEIGTPWAVTIDHQSLEDRTVTLRDRDSLEQIRLAIDELGDEIERRLRAPWTSPKLELIARRPSAEPADVVDPQGLDLPRVDRPLLVGDARAGELCEQVRTGPVEHALKALVELGDERRALCRPWSTAHPRNAGSQGSPPSAHASSRRRSQPSGSTCALQAPAGRGLVKRLPVPLDDDHHAARAERAGDLVQHGARIGHVWMRSLRERREPRRWCLTRATASV